VPYNITDDQAEVWQAYTDALTAVLPNATRATIPGGAHAVDAEALAPVLPGLTHESYVLDTESYRLDSEFAVRSVRLGVETVRLAVGLVLLVGDWGWAGACARDRHRVARARRFQ